MNSMRRELSNGLRPLAQSLIVSFVFGLANPGISYAESHCTALVDSRCECSGCSSFRNQKNLLIAPPSMPTEMPPGSSEFVPLPEHSVLPSQLPGDAPTQTLPDTYPQQPTFPAPNFSGENDSLPPTEPTLPSLDDTNFGQPVPANQVPQDQSVFDPLPLAGQRAIPPSAPATASAALFAASSGSTNAGAGIPAMLGDFCGLGARPLAPGTLGMPQSSSTTPVAGGDCRHKWAEFTSPCPSNRVFFTHHHYNNGLVDIGLQRGDADLFTFGLERTVWDGLASFETRMSFLGAGVESNQVVGGDTFGAELGNLSTAFKILLINERSYALSAGTITVWPTGDDGTYEGVGGTFEIRNESIHVMPFLAWLYRPNNLWFHQANAQLDFDSTGDTILVGDNQVDIIQDQTFLYLDYSIGRWLHSSDSGFVRRMAGIFELHYSTSVSDADLGQSGFFAGGNVDVLNATAGMHFQFGNATTFRIGGGAPLRSGDDRAFDSEITMQLAKYF